MDYEDLCRVFTDEMHRKFLMRVTKPGNTPEPWKDFSTDTLIERLFEEIDELKEAVRQFKEGEIENLVDELLDVANFCMFLWGKVRIFN